MTNWNRTIASVAAVLSTAAILLASGPRSRADGTNTAAAKPTPYPLDTCIVSGEKFGGDMGDPIVFVYTTNGVSQEIKCCCSNCPPKFKADPAKYMKIIQDAQAKAKPASK